jgi:hypothetical protein
MSLYPDPVEKTTMRPRTRSVEDIDRMLALVRRYWLANPSQRFEWMVNRFMPDYHYNPDEDVEELLRRALERE